MDPKNPIFSNLPLPPLEPEIAALTTIIMSESPDYQKQIKETKAILDKFQLLFNKYMKKCEITITSNPEIIQRIKNLPKGSNPTLNFVFQKLSRLILNHKNITREINAQIGATISVSSVFFSVLLSANIAGTFDFEGFHQYTKKVFRKNEEYQRLYRKIKCLQAYCIREKEFTPPDAVTFDILSKHTPNIIEHFDHVYSYAPTSPFDILLENYFIDNNFKDDLSKIVKDISGNGQPLSINASKKAFRKRQKLVQMNPTSFNEFFQKFIVKVREKVHDITECHVIVLKNSFLRILFNHIYLDDPLICVNDFEFQKNAYAIMRLTPNDMCMPDIFKGEEREKTFLELFRDIEELKEISSILTTLQFFTDPLDIAYEVCKVSTMIDNFAEKRSPSYERIKLNFDDFFIIFVVCICSAEIPNSEGIRLSVDFYSDLETSQMMKHAITSISAAISFIKDFISSNQLPELVSKCLESLKDFK